MLNRVEKLRNEMNKQDIDAVFIDKKEDVIYLSGFLGDDTFLFITKEKPYIITDFRYVEQAQKEALGYEILRCENKLWEQIKEIVKSKDIKTIGIQEDAITYSRFKQYNSNLDGIKFTTIEDVLKRLRIVKTPDEIKEIKKAVKVADDAFTHIVKYIKVGMTEKEVALELEYFMKKKGASGLSFETIVASGVRSSMPHGVASNKKIEYGDTITLDYGAIYNSYCSDMTRTIFIGEPNKDILKIYDIVKKAQLEGIKYSKKGVLARDVDNASRDIIDENGYGEFFGHALGHGVGIEVHEEPRVSRLGKTVLEDNMVITIEPGIYIPKLGGVRIEDMVVIQGNKADVLTSSSKEIIVI